MKTIKNSIVLIALGNVLTISANWGHTIYNDSGHSIHVSVLYHSGTDYGHDVIRPYSSRTFHTNAKGYNIKRIDIRNADKSLKGQKPFLSVAVSDNIIDEYVKPIARDTNTTWSFTTKEFPDGRGGWVEYGVLTNTDGAWCHGTNNCKVAQAPFPR